jgi:membrane fusion protein (multidrug efflux system)
VPFEWRTLLRPLAGIGQAHANLEAAKLDLSYTTIVAPVDGVVTRKSVEVGQVVQQGQGLLMLVPLQDVWVTANFKETQLADVRNGQKAEVKADLSGKTYPATWIRWPPPPARA